MDMMLHLCQSVFFLFLCVCVCVCVCERERERECFYFKAVIRAVEEFADLSDLICGPLFFTPVCASGASDEQIS